MERAVPGFGHTPLRLAGPRRSWTEEEAEAAVRTLAEALAAAGAGPGMVVGHAFGLEPVAAVALAAIAATGAFAAPADPRWTRSELESFLAAAGPRLAVTPPDTAWAGSAWTARTTRVPGFDDIALRSRDASSPAPANPGMGGALLRTSGTGGRPRLVVHEWRSLWANALAANGRLSFGSDRTWLATMAWAHVGGLAPALRAAAAGAALAFGPRSFDAGEVLRALEARKASHVSLVPAMLHRLLELGRPPPALRVALLGGAASPRRLVERALEAGWPIALTYGLTEAGSQVATATPGEVRARPGSVGLPLPGVELRIRPLAGGSAPNASSDEEVGQIEIRGPTLFLGYAGGERRDPAAWHATGDLGRLDSEGRLVVIGRKTHRIVTGGANVDPGEVEAVLSLHPDVREAVVLGTPDEVYGEIVTAIVVGRKADLAGRLEPWARERLSGPRAPRRWKFLDRLPRTASGKVDRARLRTLILPDAEDSP